MKMIYTSQELTQLTPEEMMDILSVTTIDNKIIFLDDIAAIEKTKVILKHDLPELSVNSESSYEMLLAKLTRFKMLKMTGSISPLEEKNKIDHDFNDRIQQLENLVDNKITKLEDSIKNYMSDTNNLIGHVISEIDRKMSGLIDNLGENIYTVISDKITKCDNELLDIAKISSNLSSKISEINIHRLNKTVDHLETVSKILAEVVDD